MIIAALSTYIPFLVIATLFIVAGCAWYLKTIGGSPQQLRANYYLLESVVTPTEREFRTTLFRAAYESIEDFDAQYTILMKIRLADIFGIASHLKGKGRQIALNKIAAKHIDFLIVDWDFKPVAGIELDDRSHLRADRARRDEFVDSLFESAGIKLVRIPAKAKYDKAEIARAIGAALARPKAA